jgi:hypothetical protein
MRELQERLSVAGLAVQVIHAQHLGVAMHNAGAAPTCEAVASKLSQRDKGRGTPCTIGRQLLVGLRGARAVKSWGTIVAIKYVTNI